MYHIDVPRTQCRYNDKQCTLICQETLKINNEWIRWFACGPAVQNFEGAGNKAILYLTDVKLIVIQWLNSQIY